MNIERQENGNIVFTNENGSYTFVDMGSYVGYRSREWYEEAPSCWRLMFYDNNNEQAPVHIEALVDTYGDYQRILVNQDYDRRVLLLRGGVVDEDTVYVGNPNSEVPHGAYVSFQDVYREKRHPLLETYLTQEHQFSSRSGQAYTGNITSNDVIVNFLRANQELSKSVNDALSEQNTK